MKRIVHISFSDNIGGAGIAAYRLHHAMVENKIDSKMLVVSKREDDSSVVVVKKSKIKRVVSFVWEKIYSLFFNKSIITIGAFSTGKDGVKLSKHPFLLSADIIYLHWINWDTINISEVKNILSLNKPVYWFLHDMWPFTGGCHYSFECYKYITQCSLCPNIIKNNGRDIARNIFNYKIDQWSNYSNLCTISPSIWMKNCADKSKIFSICRNYHIPNLVETEIFKPCDKKTARKILNIADNKKVILFGADNGSLNPYKGWEYMVRALYLLRKYKDIEIVTFGKRINSADLCNIPLRIHSIGRMQDKYSLSLLYNSADVFIMPSLAENFGQTVLESMACGTPVVGFDVGGIPEIVITGVTGYLSKYKDADDLARGILYLLYHNNLDEISKKCINIANDYSANNIVDKHVALWNIN